MVFLLDVDVLLGLLGEPHCSGDEDLDHFHNLANVTDGSGGDLILDGMLGDAKFRRGLEGVRVARFVEPSH